MGKNKTRDSAEAAVAATQGGSKKSSAGGVLAPVVLAFAMGIGVTLMAMQSCASTDSQMCAMLQFTANVATPPNATQASAASTKPPPPLKKPPLPKAKDSSATAAASKQGIGAGGVGAAPGQDPWIYTTHPKMATEGWNWTQLSMSRAGNFRNDDIRYLQASEVTEHGAMWVWHTTFARSIPAVVRGLASAYADKLQHWHRDDYRREWGANRVVVAFSDDAKFNRGEDHPEYGRVVVHPDRIQTTFAGYLDLVEARMAAGSDGGKEEGGEAEHLAVQQSPSRDFGEFGLPSLPPLLEDLVKYTLNARNFWAATPPKVSILHYDWQDSVLLQLSGSKRFTIIDPARLETAYPCVAYLQQLKRVGPGRFERVVTPRELDNFPLVNLTHPDLLRHPLFKEARPFTVTLQPGDALLLPAYWYHQVDSYADEGKLNVAVNYWFQGHSLATRLYRTLRENLFINCTEPIAPGEPHPCRDPQRGTAR